MLFILRRTVENSMRATGMTSVNFDIANAVQDAARVAGEFDDRAWSAAAR